VGLLWWSSAKKPTGTHDVEVPSQAARSVPDSPPAPEVATSGRDVGSATSTDGPRDTTGTSEPRRQNDPQTTDKPGTRRDTSTPASRSGPTEVAQPRRAINRGSGADFGGLFDSLAAFRSDGSARGGARDGKLIPGETRISFEGKRTIKVASAPQPGKGINAPTILDYVPPVYPPAAEAAGVQGVVTIDAGIDENGRVQEAKVRRSVPLLDQAAIDAVKQWKYSPARNLAGVPISAIMTISVTFQLK
jgi:TonB family protein